MKILKGKHSWLTDGDVRIDASFHLSEGRVTRKLLENSPLGYDKLKDITLDIFYGGRNKRTYVENDTVGIPFMGSSDMLKPDFNSLKFISKKLTKNLNGYLLKEGWVLISRSGTVGNTAYVNKDFENKAASEHIIRVVPKGNYKSGYLYSFLSSKFGYSLMTQGMFGAVIQHIEPDYLSSLPIPIMPKAIQQQSHNLIIEAATLRVEANKLFKEADSIFTTALDINHDLFKQITHPSESATAVSFKVKMSQITSLSLRSRTYSERLRLITDIFERVENNKLIDLLEYPPVKGGRYKRVEVNETSPNAVELLNQGDLHVLNPKGKIISKKYIDSLDNQTAKRNMIIVPAVGTLGENEIFSRPLFVHGYLEGKVLSEHLLRIMPDGKKIDPGYLFTVLKSKLFFRIFRSLVYGTNLLYYILPLLERIPIPRLAKDVEAEVGLKVRQAYEKLTAAIDRESKAIILIEQEIESWQK